MAVSQYLKQAKSLFMQNKFHEALSVLELELEDEPENLGALVLKGAAEQRLHDDENSIATFQRALKLSPRDLTVWKGLTRTYFQARKFDPYFDAMVHTLAIIAESESGNQQYAEALNIFERGSHFLNQAREDVPVETRIKLLEMQIPLPQRGSPELDSVYNFFEGNIFPNYAALDTLLAIRHKELSTAILKIKARARTSINVTEKTAKALRLEEYQKSGMEALLKLKISIEDNDDARRVAEADLLQLLDDELLNTSDEASKTHLQARIKTMVDGMVMFQPVKPLAFELSWDWQLPVDPTAGIESELVNLGSDGSGEEPEPSTKSSPVKDFIELFPSHPLAKLLTAKFSPNMPKRLRAKAFEIYDGSSVYGWSIAVPYLIADQQYEVAIDAIHAATKAISARRTQYGMDLTQTEQELRLAMAEAYLNYQAPKNFGLAEDLFDGILRKDPDNIKSQIGKGLVLSHSGQYEEAISLFQKVVEVNPDNIVALSELSWCRVRFGDIEEGIEGLKRSLSLISSSGHAETKWRIGYALWISERREESFDWFVSSLKESPGFAPAYTYLGMFYEDVERDHQRSQRCYYKALELDNGQFLAGERLASEFASNKQWDLVEVVASTVLSSGKLSNTMSVDWPYIAMGIVCLNGSRYADAVKYFQRCLKSESDMQAWIGLGEAYIHSGRYRSAEKALRWALKIDPSNFSALYILSLAQRAVADFPSSADSLHKALEYAPRSSDALFWALADNSLRAAEYFSKRYRLGEALEEVQSAFESIIKALSGAETPSNVSVMWGTVTELVMLLQNIGKATLDDVPSLKPALAELSSRLSKGSEWTRLADFACLTAAEYVDLATEGSKSRRATSHFCAALANSMAGNSDVAIEEFQASIALEPKNDRVWSAYGVCIQAIDPLVAQHCLIRSLSLNGRAEDTWVRLAGLYLTVEDPELASEALDRALSLNPDNCRAWVAQALIQSAQGTKSTDHLQKLFSYAYSLGQNDQLASFCMALEDYEAGDRSRAATLGALETLLAVEPVNRDAKLIMGLMLEHSGDYEGALAHLEPLSEWCHVARLHLALGQYEKANEAAAKNMSESREAILSELLTKGLASYFMGDFDSSIDAFTLALEHDKAEDVLRLLVEVLYASGTDDSRQAALDQLYESITTDGATLQATMLLGVLGLLNKDAAVIDAARAELKAQITPDVKGEPLAQACHVLSLLEDSNSSYQRALFQWPTEYALWRRVDKAQALLVAVGNSTSAAELSRAHTEAGGLVNCQRAVFYEPSSELAWRGLAESLVKQ